MTKEELHQILQINNFQKLEAALTVYPRITRKLLGFLYHKDESLRNSTARGFEIAAGSLQIEKKKDQIRRMMWMLNDESGSCCWAIPAALAEIGRSNPPAMKDFINSLKYYAADPDNNLSMGVKKALVIIENAQ